MRERFRSIKYGYFFLSLSTNCTVYNVGTLLEPSSPSFFSDNMSDGAGFFFGGGVRLCIVSKKISHCNFHGSNICPWNGHYALVAIYFVEKA